ncbi:hypothetical protein C8J57DRAFT_1324982 [Mycena rebaudengoi]|nr:hypothetical protein C8J57DRAFT_1324982 [Mycena rebaudengoi]
MRWRVPRGRLHAGPARFCAVRPACGARPAAFSQDDGEGGGAATPVNNPHNSPHTSCRRSSSNTATSCASPSTTVHPAPFRVPCRKARPRMNLHSKIQHPSRASRAPRPARSSPPTNPPARTSFPEVVRARGAEEGPVRGVRGSRRARMRTVNPDSTSSKRVDELYMEYSRIPSFFSYPFVPLRF